MVNTFIVGPNLDLSSLDTPRMGKQRVEAFQIIKALESPPGTNKWQNHPTSRMWKNHVMPLKIYYNACLKEWERRGYRNDILVPYPVEDGYTIVDFTGLSLSEVVLRVKTIGPKTFPWWVGFEPFYLGNRAALIRKNPQHYLSLFSEPRILPYLRLGYLWPYHLDPQDYTPAKHHPLSSGSPPQFRFSHAVCQQWAAHPEVNPATGARISSRGTIYQDYARAWAWYQEHPVESAMEDLVDTTRDIIDTNAVCRCLMADQYVYLTSEQSQWIVSLLQSSCRRLPRSQLLPYLKYAVYTQPHLKEVLDPIIEVI